jgi:hypothetical protein
MLMNATCFIEKWPKDLNDEFYLFVHKLVPKKAKYLADEDHLKPKIVIRRNLEFPIVMA